MRRWIIAGLLLAAPVSSWADGFTPAQRAEIVQTLREALRTDPSILRDAVAALQQDDVARQEASAQSAIASHGAALADSVDPAIGNPAGDVTIVEFYDTRCPYCRRMLPTVAALLKSDPGIRFIYKDMPILGPASTLESQALLAAQRQGGYAKLQDALMRVPSQPTRDTIRATAEREGLDGERLLQDMADPAIASRLDANIRLASALHIEGTPAFVIGQRLVPGAIDLPELQRLVAAARRR